METATELRESTVEWIFLVENASQRMLAKADAFDRLFFARLSNRILLRRLKRDRIEKGFSFLVR